MAMTKLTGKALDKAYDGVTKDHQGRHTRHDKVWASADTPRRVAERVEQQRAFLAYVAGDERRTYTAYCRYVADPAWDGITYRTLAQQLEAERRDELGYRVGDACTVPTSDAVY